MRYENVSLISDYGMVDESAGVVKAVIRSLAPHAYVIDITHQIELNDVRSAALMLARTARHLPPGVVIADVESEQHAFPIAVEVGDGESVLIGPNNGILAPVVALLGAHMLPGSPDDGMKTVTTPVYVAGSPFPHAASLYLESDENGEEVYLRSSIRVVSLGNTDFHLGSASSLFKGRDVYAPVAAHLCNGADLAEMGDLIDESALVPALIPFSSLLDGVIEGDVLYVDRYGFAHTNITAEQLQTLGNEVALTLGTHEVKALLASTISELQEHQTGLVVDEDGLVVVVFNAGSPAERYGVTAGVTALTLRCY